VSTWLSDFAFGIRTLRKNPAFAITALVTLALGIGASTAIFSVVNAVLLKPLPYAQADRLVIVTSDMRNRHVYDFQISPGDLKDIRDNVNALDGVAGVLTFATSLTGDESDPVQIRGGLATVNLFSLLGVKMAAGRDFNDDDATPPPPVPAPLPGVPVVVPPPVQVSGIISYQFWKRRYGGDPKIVGKIVAAGGNRVQIVGVAGPEFELLFPARTNVTRVPDMLTAARVDLNETLRINVLFRLIGRLKPGASVGSAQAQLDALAASLRERFTIKKTAGVYFRVEPMHENLVADVRPIVLALMGAVVFVLLIACANVANLILVRTSRRERELAVRAALGGSRARLVRQMLAEALVLAAGGALLGFALADFGVKLLLQIGPANLPRVEDVRLDPTVLVFTIVAGLISAAVFGVVPALRASRPDLISTLRQGGRNSELGGGRILRNGVVMAEVALAFVLLIGSGLMFRSFLSLVNTNPGYDSPGLMTFFAVQTAKRLPQERQAWVDAMHQRLAAIPGVTGVSFVFPLPLDGNEASVRWGTESAVTDPSTFQQADLEIATPGYFDVMHIRLLDGRDFTEADNIPTGTAIIVDNVLAAKAFPGERAVGKRLYMRSRGNTPEWMDIIGVVAHTRQHNLALDGREQMYMADGEFGYAAGSEWVLRTNGDASNLAAAARAATAAVDPLVPVADVKPMQDYVRVARAPTRFALMLIGIFAGIAVVLSGVGLYGVLSTVVRHRTAEIGVRIALGSSKREIFQLVIGQGMRLSAAGIGLGLAAAFALTRAMRSMLVGVAPTDPATFAAVALLFCIIAAAACWLPARRAAGLDPITALRDE
jgi:predicted permease